MMEMADRLILYHGSYCEIKSPNLNKCAKRKDFGQGFYVTSSREQAISFLNTSIAKAVANGSISEKQDFGYVSVFEFNLSNNLETYIFKGANKEWLHCIAAHRRKNIFGDVEVKMSNCDVIVGKIADDTTNATLTAYIAGVFGKIGTSEADEFCIKQLLPHKLKDQYCFRTLKSLEFIKFIESEKICLRK